MGSQLEGLRQELRERLKRMPVEAKADLKREVRKATGKWFPSPGPQTLARDSLADVILFGGQGGGGKTDEICGLALTEHTRSLIMRRHYVDLGAICERAIEINGTRKGFSGSIPPKLRTDDGRLVEFGAAANLGDKHHWQGQPHDGLFIDEAVQFLEAQVRFLMGWVRSTKEGQRKRVMLCSNPPVGTQGDWIISMFAPWLDPQYSDPAKPGELRWVVTDLDGKDLWVEGPDTQIEDGQGGYLIPQSRTFIPARLSDNPYLKDTGYKAQLDALPEPLRSAVRDGNFMASRVDEVDQVIPTDWVRQAQARWRPEPPIGVPQCSIGVDGARVHDDSVLAPRYDGWYAPLVAVSGTATPHGSELAGLITTHRRNRSIVVIDVVESVGAQAYALLRGNDDEHCIGYRGGDPSTARTKERQLGFFNKRSETYWKFREALDPGQDGGSPIALPPDPELVSDLTALTFEVVPRGIKVLSKEKVVEKLGRSPNKGDAVVMAWSDGAKIPTYYHPEEQGRRGKANPVNYGGKGPRRR